jgi:hypothetical protein
MSHPVHSGSLPGTSSPCNRATHGPVMEALRFLRPQLTLNVRPKWSFGLEACRRQSDVSTLCPRMGLCGERRKEIER